jgi:hypothetical protein
VQRSMHRRARDTERMLPVPGLYKHRVAACPVPRTTVTRSTTRSRGAESQRSPRQSLASDCHAISIHPDFQLIDQTAQPVRLTGALRDIQRAGDPGELDQPP